MFAFMVFVIAVPIAFIIEMLMVKWLAWALYDVGYLPHALTMDQASVVALPLFVASLIAVLFSSAGGN